MCLIVCPLMQVEMFVIVSFVFAVADFDSLSCPVSNYICHCFVLCFTKQVYVALFLLPMEHA